MQDLLPVEFPCLPLVYWCMRTAIGHLKFLQDSFVISAQKPSNAGMIIAIPQLSLRQMKADVQNSPIAQFSTLVGHFRKIAP